MTALLTLLGLWATVNTVNPAWIAALGTIAGGVLLKVTEKWLNKNAEQMTVGQDYRQEIKDLWDHIQAIEDDLIEWKEKYYASQEQILTLKAMMIGAGIDPDKAPKKDL